MAYHKKRRRGQQALYIAKTCGTSHNGIIYEKKIIIPRKANLIHEKKRRGGNATNYRRETKGTWRGQNKCHFESGVPLQLIEIKQEKLVKVRQIILNARSCFVRVKVNKITRAYVEIKV